MVEPKNLETFDSEEEAMSQRSRRGFLLSLIVPFALSANACARPSPSQKVADQFMEAYYVRLSVKDAVPFTEGLAKEKLKGQLELMTGDGGPATSQNKPRVTYSLTDQQHPSADVATYFYKVSTHMEDVGKRTVFIKLRREGNNWIITQFSEDDAPPSS